MQVPLRECRRRRVAPTPAHLAHLCDGETAAHREGVRARAANRWRQGLQQAHLVHEPVPEATCVPRTHEPPGVAPVQGHEAGAGRRRNPEHWHEVCSVHEPRHP